MSRRKDDRKNPGKISPGGLCFKLLCLLFLLLAETVSAAVSLAGTLPDFLIADSRQSVGTSIDEPFAPGTALRILYTANTHGVLYPCPSWGRTSFGGVARRATVLRTLRSEGPFPVLYIVGADEFSVDAVGAEMESPDDPSPELVQRLYNALRPDAGYLSSSASVWFGDLVPSGFSRVGERPVTRRIEIGDLSIALIFFPDFRQEARDEDKRMLLSSVLAAAHDADDVDLRIGVSPWGFQEEYAAREGLAQAFHIVLGAGEGVHFPLDASVMGPALWVRAAEDGRSLVSLDLENCPPRGTSPVWIPGTNIQAREIRLGDDIPGDRGMEKLLESWSVFSSQDR